MKWLVLLGLMLVGPVWAAPSPVVVVRGALVQGGFLVGKVAPRDVVQFEGVKVEVAPDGLFVVGFDRGHGPQAALKVCDPTAVCSVERWKIAAWTFKIQTIRGVDNRHVNPDPAELAQMEEDSKAIHAARQGRSGLESFAGQFSRPAQGPVTGIFGSRRTYNGEERSWHKGMDFAAPVGTPVRAPADAVVRLAQMTFMTGNLIVLDHGGRLYTVYAHLSKMKVKEGETVKRGQVIGAIGTTGRSTGPHLHWGAYWRDVALDPMFLLKPDVDGKRKEPE